MPRPPVTFPCFQSEGERFGPMEGGGAGDYGDPQHPPDMEAALEAPPAPQRGTGRKRGRPKGSGRGRASKGASPSHSPKPVTNQFSARLSKDCFCFPSLPSFCF